MKGTIIKRGARFSVPNGASADPQRAFGIEVVEIEMANTLQDGSELVRVKGYELRKDGGYRQRSPRTGASPLPRALMRAVLRPERCLVLDPLMPSLEVLMDEISWVERNGDSSSLQRWTVSDSGDDVAVHYAGTFGHGSIVLDDTAYITSATWKYRGMANPRSVTECFPVASLAVRFIRKVTEF